MGHLMDREQQVPPLRRPLRFAQGPTPVGMTSGGADDALTPKDQRQKQRAEVPAPHGVATIPINVC
jgi:hypothetical protein